MSGSRQGTVYFTDVVGTPILPTATHKTLFTRDEGVFVVNSAGTEVRLDDAQLIAEVSGALSTEISASAVSLLQGSLPVTVGQRVVHVTYTPSVAITAAYPVVTLVGPNDDSVIYPLSINDRTTSSFDIVLGGAPDVSGYAVEWFMATGGMTGGSSGGSGGGTSTLTVSGAGTIVNGVTILQFAGIGLESITDVGGGTALVNISGGGGTGGTSAPSVVSASLGATHSFDGLADVYDYTLSEPLELSAPSSLINGRTIIIKFTQPVAGGATVSFVAANGLTWKLPNGVLNLSTDTGSAVDIVTVVRIGSDVYVSAVKNLQ